MLLGLLKTLEAMTTLPKLHGDNKWAEQPERCRSSIAQSNYHGVDRLLCPYGGMGSLNDVSCPGKKTASGLTSFEPILGNRRMHWRETEGA